MIDWLLLDVYSDTDFVNKVGESQRSVIITLKGQVVSWK